MKNKNISIKISSEIYKKIKDCAKKETRTIKAVFELGAVQYLQKQVLER